VLINYIVSETVTKNIPLLKKYVTCWRLVFAFKGRLFSLEAFMCSRCDCFYWIT